MFIAFIYRCVLLLVLILRYRLPYRSFHFLRRWPNFTQVDGLSRRIRSQWLARQIQIHCSSQCVRHYQRWRSQIVRSHQRMNAPLEIAIAAQHCHRNHIIFLDRRPNRFRQRSAVTNARRASIANQVKFQFVQILRKASLQQIIRHHF